MKKIFRLCAVAALLLGALAHSRPVMAAFPSQPITLIVPFSAGGATDLDARAFSTVAAKYLGQPVMVANKPGGSGAIGSQYVNLAKPDGYNILIGRPGAQGILTACSPETTPFTLDSFTFLGMFDQCPFVLTVAPDAPYKTLGELVEYIRANPGKLRYSSSGVNSTNNFAIQNMLNKAGLPPDSLVHVPYKSGGDALTAIMSGHSDMMVGAYNEAAGHIKSGTIRPLALLTNDPYPPAPDIPNAAQAGMPELEFVGWSVLLGPKGMPQEVRDKYWEVIQQVAKDPEWQRMINDIGIVPMLRDPVEARKYVDGQNAMFREVGEKIGIVKK